MPNQPVKAPDSRSHINLGPLKKPFEAWCKEHGKKVSAEVRDMVSARLAEDRKPLKLEIDEGQGGAKDPKTRVELKLTPSEFAAVQQQAKLEGYSAQRWIIALVRSRLTGAPEFNAEEARALVRSTAQLAHVGRNINQIAKALNSDMNEAKHFKIEVIERLSSLIANHMKKTSALIAANVDRWNIRNG